MIRLVGAELLRLRARRMTWVTAIVLLLGLGLFQLVVNSEVTPPSASEVAQNQQYYNESVKDWETNHVQYEQECVDGGGTAADCAYPKPSPSDYELTATPFADVGGLAVTISTYLTLFAGFLLASSYIGAEYGSGALANWLTFVPERFRVLGSKLIAVVIAAAVAALVANALTLGVAALLTHLHGGALGGLDTMVASAARGVVLVVLGSLIGFCCALLTRHTVAALGVLLAVLVVGQVVAVLGFSQPFFAKAPPWMPQPNLSGFLNHGTTYSVPVTTVTADGSSTDYVEKKISFTHATVYWSVLTAVFLAATALVFRRRDVT